MRIGTNKIATILTLIDEDETDLPAWVMFLQDGGCVTGGNSPFILYYPSFEMMAAFTGVVFDDYKLVRTNIEEWDVDSTDLGPIS